MWGWAETRAMTKRDLKSIDVFAFGLIWAEALGGQAVLSCQDGVDPDTFRLVEILQKVDRPKSLNELKELRFRPEALQLAQKLLSGDLDSVRSGMMKLQRRMVDLPESEDDEEDEEDEENEPPPVSTCLFKAKLEKVLRRTKPGIRMWVQEHAEIPKNMSDYRLILGAMELMARASKFSYKERASVSELLEEPYFADLRLNSPPLSWSHRKAPYFEDVGEALSQEQEKQIRACWDFRLRRRKKDPLSQEVAESVEKVCLRVRKELTKAGEPTV